MENIVRPDPHVFDRYTDPETLARIVDFESVSEMLSHAVRAFGAAPAVLDDGATYTFEKLGEDAAALRGALLAAGVLPKARVAILFPNCYDFVRAYLAVTTLGASAVLLPPHLDENAVFGISYQTGARVILTSEALAEKANLAKTRLGAKVLTPADFSGAPAPAALPSGDDEATVIFTGGTTGKSKGAALSNRAVMRGVKNGCYGCPDVFGERYFLVLPLTHVFGLIRNLLSSIYTGSAIWICRNTKDMFREIAVFRPTVLVLVPALAEMALNLSKQFGRNMLGDSLKYIICGASAVAPYLIEEYKKLGVTIFPGYGLTESANLVSGNPESASKPASVGIPYPGQELRVVDGELWLRGVNMMSGYIGAPEENAAAYTDGWFRTGDLVRFDEDGFLYIIGRTKELIVLSTGEKVSPAEVEAKFDTIEAIQDCLLYKEENEAGGEILTLEVLPRAVVIGKLGITDVPAYLHAQIEKINKTLPPFSRVNRVVIRDKDFERSPAMKILRKH